MESLNIDFFDPDDIRAKLPLARKHLNTEEAALRAKVEDVEGLREYVAILERRVKLSGPASAAHATGSSYAATDIPNQPPKSPSREAQPLDLVVEVVNRENRKIRAKDVAETLRSEGHDMPNMVVSNALFYGAKRADPPRIQSAAGRGYYAPLGYNPFLEGATVNGNVAPAGNPHEPGSPNPGVQLDAAKPPGDQLIPDRPGHPINSEGAAGGRSRLGL
jgi:hypothetical protein